MSTIYLDVSRSLSRLYHGLKPTGVDRVSLAYVARYRAQARAVLSEAGWLGVLSEKDSQRAFDLLLSVTRERNTIRRLIARACIGQMFGGKRCGPGVLLHLSHNGMEHGRYYQALSRREIRTVFMVHDLIPLTHAEYCRTGIDVKHRSRIHTALRQAHGLIANSQDTLDELAAEARSARLFLPPTVVAHLAPGISEASLTARPFNANYFVILGTIEPRKNHWFILHVWRRVVESLGDAAPKLVIIGRRGWECENAVDMLERCAALRGVIIEEPECDDDRLRAWLQHSQALLFPSFAEGFGMPLVEALAMGVPVIASNLGVFHEIAGEVPHFLDPLDGPGWKAAIESYARSDSDARRAQLARIDQFRVPTWPDHFDKIDGFLEELTR
ncbi:glycosyltransferase family 4 protein [Paraburkholderia sp. RCC_158]|uniref:glycosyltransferase family 4 protein n=1 Tax=Paraburkholderia sp. RCC_158 TaxID=3239220 RepID=UPI0035266D77